VFRLYISSFSLNRRFSPWRPDDRTVRETAKAALFFPPERVLRFDWSTRGHDERLEHIAKTSFLSLSAAATGSHGIADHFSGNQSR
jgi:hypothetical protein